MSNLTDQAFENASDIVRTAFGAAKELTQQNQKNTVWEKFRKNYEHLDPLTVERVRMALGHRDSEQNPCQVCKFVADKEMKLAQQEL